MPKSWPYDVIRELLTRAELEGEASATLDSVADARLFRYACYSFRRKYGVGLGLSITVEDSTVVVRPSKILPIINIHSPTVPVQ